MSNKIYHLYQSFPLCEPSGGWAEQNGCNFFIGWKPEKREMQVLYKKNDTGRLVKSSLCEMEKVKQDKECDQQKNLGNRRNDFISQKLKFISQSNTKEYWKDTTQWRLDAGRSEIPWRLGNAEEKYCLETILLRSSITKRCMKENKAGASGK